MIKLKRILGKMWGKCLTVVKQFFPCLKAKLNKTKKWFINKKKHEKFIIGGISLASLLVIVVCGFTIDFSRIFGSVYDIEDISTNIDDIKIGDTINYTANGYSDWEVLNINKEDNTIDIVTKTTPEYVTIPCEMNSCNNYSTILQKTADRYLDGKYAIKAKSIGPEDFKVFRSLHSSYDDFWINSRSAECLQYSNASQCFSNSYSNYIGYYIPVVQIDIADTSNMNVGDIYNYSLNGIDEWFVTHIWTGTINMIPKYAPVVNFSNSQKESPLVYFQSENAKYIDENVNYISEFSDIDLLNSLNYTMYNSEYSYFYTGRCNSNISNYVNGSGISAISTRYEAMIYTKNSDNTINTSSSKVYFNTYSFSSGFRPVVTIKYSDEEKNSKDRDHNLNVGDYVKYSANGYNNWKVLNIDKKNNTVDIISGGLVKNITLEGKEDYDNLNNILQEEVDKYGKGKDVVGVRSVDANDLDNLKRMNDQLSIHYFLNNKIKYRSSSDGIYTNLMVYAVEVAYYDTINSELSNDWAILANETIPGSSSKKDTFKYKFGLRPVVTLKLPKVEIIENVENIPSIEESNSVLIKEQNKANKSSPSVVNNSEIKEENIVKYVSGDTGSDCPEIKVMQDNYFDYIILIIINIILTIIVFSLGKIKEWLFKRKKNKKLVVTSASVLALVVTTVFALTLNSKSITGSIYDINNIGSNIDDINVGDTINYEANGYRDWEVLNINKEDNTIDIVSKTSTEELVMSSYDALTNYYDILNTTAAKYVDNKYAVSARCISEKDLVTNDTDDIFWLDKRSDKYLYTNIGSVLLKTYEAGYFVPVVNINNIDSSDLVVGDSYSYSINGIDEWIILYIDNATSISIIPKKPPVIDLSTNSKEFNISSYVSNEIQKYVDDRGFSVRSIQVSDVDALNSISYGAEFEYKYFYTDNLLDTITESDSTSKYTRYVVDALQVYTWSNNKIYSNELYCYDGILTAGFRPVVTIKYSDKEKEGKDVKTDLQIGDYVKYSANGYNNWKVLNINKENNTVDIISGGLVKNITLEGKEDYDNLETVLQEEVDKYKSGKYVVGARSVSTMDLESLREMKDDLSARYFLNDKVKHNNKTDSYYWGSLPTYTVAVANYDSTISDITYDWAILEQESYYLGSYKYTAGLRPIITLDLNETKEIKVDKIEDVTTKNNTLVTEQKKYNKIAQTPIKNNKIDVITDEEYKSSDIVEESECKYNESESSDPKDSVKYKIVICLFTINIVILIAIIILNLFGFKKRRQKIKE